MRLTFGLLRRSLENCSNFKIFCFSAIVTEGKEVQTSFDLIPYREGLCRVSAAFRSDVLSGIRGCGDLQIADWYNKQLTICSVGTLDEFLRLSNTRSRSLDSLIIFLLSEIKVVWCYCFTVAFTSGFRNKFSPRKKKNINCFKSAQFRQNLLHR